MATEFYQKLFDSNILWNQQSIDLASARLAEVPCTRYSNCTMKQPGMGDWLDPELKSALRDKKKTNHPAPFKYILQFLFNFQLHTCKEELVRSIACVNLNTLSNIL